MDVKLTEADEVEIRQYLKSPFVGGSSPLFNPLTHSIGFKTQPYDGVVKDFSTLLTASRLFKQGYIESGLQLMLPGGFSFPDKIAYIYPYPKFTLKKEELEQFRSWVKKFSALIIEPNSLLSRVLYRFGRTYEAQDVHERITDAIIGLETLVSPENAPEIKYRVGQRAGFLVYDNPLIRLEIAKQVKKAYDIRSGVVHSTTKSDKATEEIADLCQDILRKSIKRILESNQSLIEEFCQYKKKHDRITNFYEYIIYFGDFQKALEYWQQSK